MESSNNPRRSSDTSVLEVKSRERWLGPATFPLFMRPVTGLFECKYGYLSVRRLRGGGWLAGEGDCKSDRMYQAHGRLRAALGADYAGLAEVGDDMIRLPTHRGYVRLDCDVLAHYGGFRIHELTTRMTARST